MSKRSNNDRRRGIKPSEVRDNRLQMPLVYDPGLYASASHVHSTGDVTSGIFDPARLGSGTATSTTYLRGDGVWATVSGSGDGSLSSHQNLSNLQGGGGGDYYHLNADEYSKVGVINTLIFNAVASHAASESAIHGIANTALLLDTADIGVTVASATHTHDYSGLYAALSHTHSYTAIFATVSHVHAASAITSGIFDPARLGSATATSTTFLRGDGQWATPTAGSGELYIQRYNTATCSANSWITFQVLSGDQVASQSNSATIIFTTTSVGAGTWQMDYHIIFQAAATTTGLGCSVNHTGASPGHFVMTSRYATTGGAAATGVVDQVGASQTAGLIEGKAERVLNTISSQTVGVDTASANCYIVVSALLVVVNTGTLQFKVTSEVGGSNVFIKAGSSLVLSKLA